MVGIPSTSLTRSGVGGDRGRLAEAWNASARRDVGGSLKFRSTSGRGAGEGAGAYRRACIVRWRPIPEFGERSQVCVASRRWTGWPAGGLQILPVDDRIQAGSRSPVDGRWWSSRTTHPWMCATRRLSGSERLRYTRSSVADRSTKTVEGALRSLPASDVVARSRILQS